MYSFHRHDALDIVEITVGGFWSVAEFGAFVRDLQDVLATSPGKTPTMSLYNYTEAAIQSQEIVLLMQELARGVAPERKVALYTEGRLARMQARRVASAGTRMAVFESRAEAMAWLTGEPASAYSTAA